MYLGVPSWLFLQPIAGGRAIQHSISFRSLASPTKPRTDCRSKERPASYPSHKKKVPQMTHPYI